MWPTSAIAPLYLCLDFVRHHETASLFVLFHRGLSYKSCIFSSIYCISATVSMQLHSHPEMLVLWLQPRRETPLQMRSVACDCRKWRSGLPGSSSSQRAPHSVEASGFPHGGQRVEGSPPRSCWRGSASGSCCLHRSDWFLFSAAGQRWQEGGGKSVENDQNHRSGCDSSCCSINFFRFSSVRLHAEEHT